MEHGVSLKAGKAGEAEERGSPIQTIVFAAIFVAPGSAMPVCERSAGREYCQTCTPHLTSTICDCYKNSRLSFRTTTSTPCAPDHLRLLRILVKRKNIYKTHFSVCPQILKLRRLFQKLVTNSPSRLGGANLHGCVAGSARKELYSRDGGPM